MSDDLVAWLRARLDEKRERATTAGCRLAWLTYRREDGSMDYTTIAAEHGDTWVAGGDEIRSPASIEVVYDPAEDLREVEADRELIAAYEEARVLRQQLADSRMRSQALRQPEPSDRERRAMDMGDAYEKAILLRAVAHGWSEG